MLGIGAAMLLMPFAETPLTFAALLMLIAVFNGFTPAGVSLLVANTPPKILALGLDRLEGHLKTIGLYRNKAKNLLQTCQILVDQHAGQVPRTREALQALPGVGRKTANVVLNSAYGEAVMAVDTHIFRVSNRTGLAPGKNVDEVEARLMKRVPAEYLVNAHHWLILHGRYVCQARQPLCGQCGVRQWCSFKDKTA